VSHGRTWTAKELSAPEIVQRLALPKSAFDGGTVDVRRR
jgi:hypothetical protein